MPRRRRGPAARRGLLLEVENGSREERALEVGLAGEWRWSLRTVESSRPLGTPNRLTVVGREGLVLRSVASLLGALAVVGAGDGVVYEAERRIDGRVKAGDGEWAGERPRMIRAARHVRVSSESVQRPYGGGRA